MSAITSLDFPLFVKWYITSRCNLRCKHCYLTDYTQKGELEKILEIIDYLGAKKIMSVVLIGGEPLIRDDLEIIITRLTAYGIKVTIATNATLVSEQRAISLMESGAKHFQVSLEGHSPELSDPMRGGNGTFNKILDGTRLLKKYGANVTFAITITAKNYHLLHEYVEFAATTQIDELKLNAFVPIGTGALLQKAYFLNSAICQQVAEEIFLLKKSYPSLKINSGAFIKPIKYYNNSDNAASVGCGAGTTSIIINSDFSLSACDMLVEEHRTAGHITSPESIAAFWKEDIVFKQWRGEAEKDEKTATIRTFKDVHKHGCHAAFQAYRRNIFKP